jgi:hypothetical protein
VEATKIISEIANSKEYRQICKKICQGSPLHEDLFQELIIVLCEYDKGKLEGIHERGQIKWFIIKILQNQFQSSTSPFYKKFRDFSARTSDLVIEAEDEQKEEEEIYSIVENETDREIFKDSNDWYENTLFKSYLREGSLRKLSVSTGISRTAIKYSLEAFKSKIEKIANEKEIFMAKQGFYIELTTSAKEQIFLAAQHLNVKPDQVLEERIKYINRLFGVRRKKPEPNQLSLF